MEADMKLMESDCYKPLNIGSEELVLTDQLADLIISISGKRLRKRYDLTKPQGVRGRNADLTLIREVLGWEPRGSYEEGLKRTYRWIQKQVRAKE
jgi:GDP-D-mannose 3',5'-epimerase